MQGTVVARLWQAAAADVGHQCQFDRLRNAQLRMRTGSPHASGRAGRRATHAANNKLSCGADRQRRERQERQLEAQRAQTGGAHTADARGETCVRRSGSAKRPATGRKRSGTIGRAHGAKDMRTPECWMITKYWHARACWVYDECGIGRQPCRRAYNHTHCSVPVAARRDTQLGEG